MTNEKKKKKHGCLKALCVFVAIILVIAIPVSIVRAVRAETKEVYGDGRWDNWNTSKAFSLDVCQKIVLPEGRENVKIMQLADPQGKLSWISSDKRTFELIEKMVEKEKPDVCVCTGDLALSIFTYSYYTSFCELMERLNVYWTVTYGNHDAEYESSKYTLYNLMTAKNKDGSAKYPHCLFDCGPSNIKGESNHVIAVYSGSATAENLKHALVMLDSNAYPADSNNGFAWVYDWIGKNQVDWYSWVVSGLKSLNADVDVSGFFHIPLVQHAEMYYAANPDKKTAEMTDLMIASQVSGVVDEADKAASELVPKRDANEQIVLDADGKPVSDPYAVGIYYQGYDTGLFDVALALGNTKGFFVGHDHVNTFRGYYGTETQKIYLCYGRCCGYHTYPFFDEANWFTKLIGKADTVMWNATLWKDYSGNVMHKGVTNVVFDFATSDYTDVYDSGYFNGEFWRVDD